MKIQEVAKEYFSDVVKNYVNYSKMIELTRFPYDEMEMDEETGKEIPVVFSSSGVSIPIATILGTVRSEFVAEYGSKPDCVECYDNYIDAFEILEGEDVLEHTRNLIRDEINKLDELNNYVDVG